MNLQPTFRRSSLNEEAILDILQVCLLHLEGEVLLVASQQGVEGVEAAGLGEVVLLGGGRVEQLPHQGHQLGVSLLVAVQQWPAASRLSSRLNFLLHTSSQPS